MGLLMIVIFYFRISYWLRPISTQSDSGGNGGGHRKKVLAIGFYCSGVYLWGLYVYETYRGG